MNTFSFVLTHDLLSDRRIDGVTLKNISLFYHKKKTKIFHVAVRLYSKRSTQDVKIG